MAVTWTSQFPLHIGHSRPRNGSAGGQTSFVDRVVSKAKGGHVKNYTRVWGPVPVGVSLTTEAGLKSVSHRGHED